MRNKIFSSQEMGQAVTAQMPAIWRFALSLSRKPDVADDLTQATCMRAIEKHAQFDRDGRLDAWCITICRSIWLNELRSQTVRAAQAIDTVPESELSALLPQTETNIFASQVFTHMMQLPEAQRETVFLVFVQGYRYSETAKILDVPIGTVMSRLASARNKLSYLADDLPQDNDRRVSP